MKYHHPLVEKDPQLLPFASILKKRSEKAKLRELSFTNGNRPLSEVANQYLYYGLHLCDEGWVFREKAPNATQIFLFGDFSYWQIKEEYALKPIGNGDWEICLPKCILKHGELFRLWMVWPAGADDRLPSYTRRVVQDEHTKVFSAQVWDPIPYVWKNEAPPLPRNPLIYEAHIGMSSEEPKVSTYWDFKQEALPHIKKSGYNTIQLMAIQEHPYYGSFGYQVSNYFAPSSRFGTPEELMELIDAAHGLGLYVILDIVHSHSVSNPKEGLAFFDGNSSLYFHEKKHPVWDSHCFNYQKDETVLLLLSNVKYWMEVFHFDGFRFDGVTSMCYWNHGIGVNLWVYPQFFDPNVDEDAIVYLTLVNKLIKELNIKSLTIAEDVSGMPGMAFPVKDGGVGFDYRLAMGVADYWSTAVKLCDDERWHVGEMFKRLVDKRAEEKTISYVESHDQAMVGDNTLIFNLIGNEMYTHMSLLHPSLCVDRGLALHKMIRLATLSLCQNGYLNFMGNEFGHPEWIDFPRSGNNWSYHYARRQWSLLHDTVLKYHYLYRFDQAMIEVVQENSILEHKTMLLVSDLGRQILAYQRSNLIFIFNFNPYNDYEKYQIPIFEEGEYCMVISTDDKYYGGCNQLDNCKIYKSVKVKGQTMIELDIPLRVGFILKKC